MNRLACLLLVAGALVSSDFAQGANQAPAATASTVKGTQRVGPLEITVVDTGFANWHSQFESFNAWGVMVRVANITDEEVSESLDAADVGMANDLGERYSVSDRFLQIFSQATLPVLNSHGLQGDLLFTKTGDQGVIIRSGGTAVGSWVSVLDKATSKYKLVLKLSPRVVVTLALVFDSPRESSPRTFFWPRAKPVDLR